MKIINIDKSTKNQMLNLLQDLRCRNKYSMTIYKVMTVPFGTTLFVIVTLLFTSCKKLIEVDPPVNNINVANVYTTDATASSVLTGLYTKMSIQNSDEYQNPGNLATLYIGCGLSADELSLFDMNNNNLNFNLYYSNELTSQNPAGFWSSIYPDIFIANSAIEGLTLSTTLTTGVKQQLLGEAKFLRAFYYFYLVNLYSDSPLAITTNYKVNRLMGRTPSAQMYEQIVTDLKEAQTLLSDQYLGGDASTIVSDRVRPNRSTATALLARVYLYLGGSGHVDAYLNSEAEASKLIINITQYDTVLLNNVFSKDSKEAIWQLQSVKTGINANTGEGKFFVLSTDGLGTAYPAYLSENLTNSFEIGDLRKSNWTSNVTVDGIIYNFPYKYKIGQGIDAPTTEYSTIFRLAEQYLIRAEARAQQNKTIAAAADLNVIRKRAGLPPTTALTKEELLVAIMQERKVELFTEGGHRWLDLKRTGQANAILKPIKGGTWQSTDHLYPIPGTEISKSPALQGHQNPGYQ